MLHIVSWLLERESVKNWFWKEGAGSGSESPNQLQITRRGVLVTLAGVGLLAAGVGANSAVDEEKRKNDTEKTQEADIKAAIDVIDGAIERLGVGKLVEDTIAAKPSRVPEITATGLDIAGPVGRVLAASALLGSAAVAAAKIDVISVEDAKIFTGVGVAGATLVAGGSVAGEAVSDEVMNSFTLETRIAMQRRNLMDKGAAIAVLSPEYKTPLITAIEKKMQGTTSEVQKLIGEALRPSQNPHSHEQVAPLPTPRGSKSIGQSQQGNASAIT